jgi:transcription elongation GreA/GreB family factor
VQTINTALSKAPKSQLALTIELAIARDELLTLAGLPINDAQSGLISLLPTTPRAFAEILEKISGPRQTKLIRAMQERGPDTWATLLLQVLPYSTARMADSITTSFASVGRAHEVVEALRRQIVERNVSSDLLYWLCKHRDELFAPLFEPNLIMAILSVLEKDLFGDIKRGTKLYDLVHSDKELIAVLLKDAETDDVRDITRSIILSPVFQELDKRSVLAIIIKLFPAMQELVVGEKTNDAETSTLIVSWESLEKRKIELEEIVTKKIPENSRDIGVARSYGDLRENHEFKSAKEMQSILMRRKAELENLLSRAQGTDFSNVDTSVVNVGTLVEVQETASGKIRKYTILGAWDSDPAQGVISYLTALASALMKHKVGDVFQLQTDDGSELEVKLNAIASYRK